MDLSSIFIATPPAIVEVDGGIHEIQKEQDDAQTRFSHFDEQ
jgi:very-short-patch-repair endonuclease